CERITPSNREIKHLVAALLQKFDRIRSPRAYLRHLVQKAAARKFTCRPCDHGAIGMSDNLTVVKCAKPRRSIQDLPRENTYTQHKLKIVMSNIT
ncbi:hypothetical protein EG244_18895, partial [Falsigemmobacter faecalis]